MKTQQIKLIDTAAAITKATVSIKNRAAKLDQEIQLVAMSAIIHLDKHGDWTLIENLVLALSAGQKRRALTEFVLANAKVRLLDKSKPEDKAALAIQHIFAFDKSKETATVEAMMENPWYDYHKEASNAMTAFDAQSAVKSLIKRMVAAGKRGCKIENTQGALEEAKLLVQTLEQGIGQQ